jgi:hypothetical protein
VVITLATNLTVEERINLIIQQAIRDGNASIAAANIRRILGPLADVRRELDHAYAKHGVAPWSRHEFYAILKEEVDELWDAIKADEPLDRVRAEAIQVAAMPVRYLETGDRYGWS